MATWIASADTGTAEVSNLSFPDFGLTDFAFAAATGLFSGAAAWIGVWPAKKLNTNVGTAKPITFRICICVNPFAVDKFGSHFDHTLGSN
jgi:hypothetical protein